ncbi:MAG: FxsA family protein, partial [Porticoccus sp.]
IILAVCGALLMTLGFVTDVIGFAGLVPGLRRWIVMRLATQVNVVNYSEHEVRCRDHGGDSDADFQTLEGESWREDDDSPVEK